MIYNFLDELKFVYIILIYLVRLAYGTKLLSQKWRTKYYAVSKEHLT